MKTYRPYTKSRRNMTTIPYKKYITTSTPEKSLISGGKSTSARNNRGRITVRHQGGGVKKLFRLVDFLMEKKDIPFTVKSVEYDPHRTGFIGLVLYRDGVKRYVLLPKTVKVGEELIVSEKASVQAGNRLPLKNIPVGTFVYNVELKPNGGGKLGRSAGNYIEVIAHDGDFTHLKMPSTEIRKVFENCWATVGQVSNDENWLVNIGKAGRNRWLGIRPTVRGSAQNPVDHPYGGGEGRQGRGLRRLKTRWGKQVGKGQKSRRPKKYSNIFIVSRRKVGSKKA